MTDKLEPCPFCRSDSTTTLDEKAEKTTVWYVLCDTCLGRGPVMSDKTQAEAQWNVAGKIEGLLIALIHARGL